jgi:O-methyltransferase
MNIFRKAIVHATKDRGLELRFRLLAMLGRLVVPEYRFKWPQLDWWSNPAFTDYLIRFREEHGMNSDRRWMLWQLLRLVSGVEGNTAECGVYQGASSYLICLANDMRGSATRCHHLFDSFEGMSKPSAEDGAHWSGGDLACGEDEVRHTLRDFKNFQTHKGWIPDRFSDVENERFSFVHIDVDLFQPTRASVEFFYPRLTDGGILVCDDFGYTTCPGATEAMNSYLEGRPEAMLPLPDGGGFFIKGLTAAESKPF